ncbi:4,5-dihydroxyphthalate decarboxylase [Pigmentiphaga litoralis]|uniref:ABC transporter substrate-binding protein n=1 Tax=Pigmentiphaga litoralis TaxID=516702 RepID=UPI0019CA118D|nr:ABC transporter substrate-binding protein [Pigmentiphaga litoralis]GGX19177.1 4,5-dihydroxyphthalate decarboxylase [Pigmentiphaga litoralis]
MTLPVPVTYAGGVYDRTSALYTGDVRPTGIDLTFLPMPIEELFWRQGKYHEFDAAEFSFGAYLASVEDPNWGFTALPIFPSRVFRHSAIYVHAESGIEHASDLAGRTVGTPEWSQTGSLWARGILGEHYGVDLRSVRWRTGGLQHAGRKEKSRVVPPAGFDVQTLAEGKTLQQSLLDREIDAIITARPPEAFAQGDPAIRRLFADYRAEEGRYYDASRIFPIMHVLIVRNALLQAYPWIAGNLRTAFEAARRPATGHLLDSAACNTSLIWESSYAEEERARFGDPFVYGVEENLPTLNAICRYAHEQGFTSDLLTPADLFFPTTLTTAKV